MTNTLLRDAIEKKYTPDLYRLRQMAPEEKTNTYKVQSGDTLSEIAERYGVGVNDISGYKSGNPDLIYPGEELSFGEMTKQTENLKPTSITPTQTPTPTQTQTPEESPDVEQWDPSEYDTKLKDMAERMKSMETDRYDKEYKAREMDVRRKEIENVDSEIARLRQQREENILDVKRNPNVSASVLTGEVDRVAKYYNDQINNKINERNSIGEEYNRELEEINGIVSREMADLEREMNYYQGMAQSRRDAEQNYQEALRQQLLDDRDQDQFEQKLALDYAKLAQPSSTREVNLQIITDRFTGQPIGVFNPSTGEVTNPITDMEGLKDTSSGSVLTQEQIRTIKQQVATMLEDGIDEERAKENVRSLNLVPEIEATYIREIEDTYPGAVRSFFGGVKEQITNLFK